MTSTRQTQFLSEVIDSETISPGTQAYLEVRAQNKFYDYVIKKFREKERHGFTTADLARRIGRRPEVVTRWLSAPRNWTISTLSLLLVGICAEEFEPNSTPFAGRPKRNFSAAEWPNLPREDMTNRTPSGSRASSGSVVWRTE